MKPNYDEGPDALKRFERGMSQLFKVPKESVRHKPTPKPKKNVRKTQENASKG
jgi:hypothetical protein